MGPHKMTAEDAQRATRPDVILAGGAALAGVEDDDPEAVVIEPTPGRVERLAQVLDEEWTTIGWSWTVLP